MEMTMNLPRNYVEIEEEEMMYLDGGATKYRNMTQALVSFLFKGVASVKACSAALGALVRGTITSVCKIVVRYCAGVTAALSALWAGSMIFAAYCTLKRYGYYTLNSIKIFGIDTGIGTVGH